MTRAKRLNRKPVDKLNGFDSRDAVWTIIRRLKRFTISELHMETTMTIESVRDYCTGLSAAGYIGKAEGIAPEVPTHKTHFIPQTWELIRDAGVIAPRVRKDGTLVIQGMGREQMWRTMRILGSFCIRDLAINASTEECQVKESSVQDYCKYLCHAGYLINTSRGCYRFLPSRYTGPRPPMIQKTKQVFDANLKKVMWSTQGGRHGK